MTKGNVSCASERIRQPPVNVLPRIVRFEGFAAREEQAVAEDDRHVAGRLPIDVEVRFPAEVCVVEAGLVDGGVGIKLVEEEQVGADLEALQRAEGRKREG